MEETIKNRLSEMEEPERSEALANRVIALYRRDITEEEDLKVIVKSTSIKQSLFRAFGWNRTAQGFKYWLDIFEKYKNKENQA